VYNSESADRDKCRMVTFASHRREADTTRTATLRDSVLLLSKKKGGIAPALPKPTIPWRFGYSTTERSISDHHNVTGNHGREARGADQYGGNHHGFTSFGWFVPG